MPSLSPVEQIIESARPGAMPLHQKCLLASTQWIQYIFAGAALLGLMEVHAGFDFSVMGVSAYDACLFLMMLWIANVLWRALFFLTIGTRAMGIRYWSSLLAGGVLGHIIAATIYLSPTLFGVDQQTSLYMLVGVGLVGGIVLYITPMPE